MIDLANLNAKYQRFYKAAAEYEDAGGALLENLFAMLQDPETCDQLNSTAGESARNIQTMLHINAEMGNNMKRAMQLLAKHIMENHAVPKSGPTLTVVTDASEEVH